MRRLGFCLVFASFLLFGVSFAEAHGRTAFLGELDFDPSNPDRIVARGTWGLAVTDDGGASWRWLCAAVIGFDPTIEDPSMAIMGDGSLLAATFEGISRSREAGCEWAAPDDVVDGEFVIDVRRDPTNPAVAWGVVTGGAIMDRLVRSADHGQTWRVVHEQTDALLIEKVRIAPGDAARVYLSGAMARTAMTERRVYFLHSSDAGVSFERTELETEEGERNAYVLGVDPLDADRVFVRMVRRINDLTEERILLTEDGGQTFQTVLRGRQLLSFTMSDDGQQVWVGSRLGDGLWRSTDRGRSFALRQTGTQLLCLEHHRGELYVCADQWNNGFAIGRSADDGSTIEPILSLSELVDLADCPTCSSAGITCPEWFPDLAYDLRIDAGIDLSGLDGSTGGPREVQVPTQCLEGGVDPVDAGPPEPVDSCACRLSARRESSTRPLLVGVFGLLSFLTARFRTRKRRDRGTSC